MKTIIIIFTLTITAIVGYAQNIELKELIDLRNKSIDLIDNTLIKKGWQMISASNEYGNIKINETKFITYAYNKNIYNDGAEFFIDVTLDDDKDYQTISIQSPSQIFYNKFLNQTILNGYTILKSIVKQNSINKLYRKDNITIVFGVESKLKDGYTITQYFISIYENKLIDNLITIITK